MQPEISSKKESSEPDELKILITADGTPTLLNSNISETYHSRHGALQESMHVFIQSGLKQMRANPIHILEIGFGTGLNAALTAIHGAKWQIHYTALEPLPVDIALLAQLRYFTDDSEIAVYHDVIHAGFDKITNPTAHFLLKKNKIKIQDFATEEKFDLVYFDAFAPMVQPEMWTQEIFSKLFEWMNNNGIIVTYCAKGQVRRNMMAAGFSVERIAGPPGKREMLRAIKRTI